MGFSIASGNFFNEQKNYMKCDCCGCKSVVKNSDVEVINAPIDPEHAKLFICIVCGDTRIRQEIEDGDLIRLKFNYQINLENKLERIGEVKAIEFHDGAGKVNNWNYLYNDTPVEKITWDRLLHERRKVLKSIVLN